MYLYRPLKYITVRRHGKKPQTPSKLFFPRKKKNNSKVFKFTQRITLLILQTFLSVCLSFSLGHLRLAALEVVLLAQVLLEARELVHDEDLEEHRGVQCRHGDNADHREKERHKAQQDHEDEAASKGVHESEVDRNHSRNRLKMKEAGDNVRIEEKKSPKRL